MVNIPLVFSTFMDTSGKECKLEFSHPFDSRCSTFFAITPPESMVKLTFVPYGYVVHEALETAGYAPKLLGRSHKPAISAEIIVMEYLLPPTNGKPGWITLFDLVTKHPALVDQKSDLIQAQLDAIVLVLKGSKLVHGDLRSNNLMIFCTLTAIVEPVQVKAVDMEWAGRVGEVYYPVDRNEAVGYPGKAGELIGSRDDDQMARQWMNVLKVSQVVTV